MRALILMALLTQSFCLYAQETPTPLPEPKITQVPELGFEPSSPTDVPKPSPSQPLAPVNKNPVPEAPTSRPGQGAASDQASPPVTSQVSPEVKAKSSAFTKQWVPTHQRPVIKRIWIPAQNVQVSREAIRTYVDACGYSYQVIEPVWEWVSTPGHYANQTVWETVPGHWEHVPAGGNLQVQQPGAPLPQLAQPAPSIAPT